MTKPNLFIIGSAKCGTTTLYSYLQKSKEIFFSIQKEPHYFLREVHDLKYQGPDDDFFFEKYPKTLTEYEKLFSDAKGYAWVGEASTMYMYYSQVAQKLFDYNPEAKIIGIVRNPIQRAYSHYLHHVREQTVSAPSFYDALKEELGGKRDSWAPQRKFIDMSMYGRQLQAYFDLFPRDQILILKFEDLMKNPNEFLGKVSEFLGVENVFQDIKVDKHNASGVPKFGMLHTVYIKSLRFMRRTFPFLTHSPLSKIRKKFDNYYRNLFLSKPKMDQKSADLLKPVFRKDIMQLEKLTGLDLKDWY
ncbi:sulfotransferase family protein [Cyclobacterium sp. SYSU L10401]|uniref:sulfotransferase family protein n=1 Tax=Cyclobacterium sp. SYSU L10401 TaxID=2678657 RepID=UPI0013D0C60A|nr:sulfotransferase [Cyclobacterium sp. SYSU L10401]